MYFAFRVNLPRNAPFSRVISELRSPGGFEWLGFQPMYHSDGTAVKNHNADDVLKEVLRQPLLMHQDVSINHAPKGTNGCHTSCFCVHTRLAKSACGICS